MENLPKVAVIYLSYHSDDYLPDAVSAFSRITYPKEKVELVIVDNFHPKFGNTVKAVENMVMPLSGKTIPHVTFLPQKDNFGFAGGNNIGIKWALENGFDYVYLHNDDGFIAPNAFEPLVQAMEEDKNIAIAQSLILLHPDVEYLNNAGNCFQYLGFGFCDEYRSKRSDLDLPKIKEVSYASGAACMLRAELIKKYGMLDSDFYMYHEDLEWCLRFRIFGYKSVLAAESVFYHKYQFSRSIQKFFYMERNRYAVLFMYFKFPTLLLLLPIMSALEIGLWLFAWRGGWLSEKIDVYKYWLNKNNWAIWREKRKNIQNIRQVSDRYLLSYSVPGIYFQEKSMASPLLKYIGNPIMTVYYWIAVKGLIWW